MYKLNLMDGTQLNLCRLNPVTFILNSNDSSIYHQLSDSNLSLAFLSDEDDILADIYIDYTLQNFSCAGDGLIQFRIGPWETAHKESNRSKKKGRGGK